MIDPDRQESSGETIEYHILYLTRYNIRFTTRIGALVVSSVVCIFAHI